MLFDVLLVYVTKFRVGKWQVVAVIAAKRRARWGDSTFWEIPKQCRIKTTLGPWRTGTIRDPRPVLLQTLALCSYMTFENAKVAKIGEKKYFFSN